MIIRWAKTILECAMESIGCCAKDLPRTRIQVHDGRRRIGVVFWVQRRRIPGWNGFWKRFGSEFRRAAAGVDKAASGGTGVEQARVFDDARQGGAGHLGESNSGQTGSEQTGPEEAQRQRAAAQMGASTALAAALEWESGLRSRIFHLRRPNIWARLQYGLDRDGVYSPALEVQGSRELKKLCLAGVPVSSWPGLLGNSPTINWGLIPFGFGKPA